MPTYPMSDSTSLNLIRFLCSFSLNTPYNTLQVSYGIQCPLLQQVTYLTNLIQYRWPLTDGHWYKSYFGNLNPSHFLAFQGKEDTQMNWNLKGILWHIGKRIALWHAGTLWSNCPLITSGTKHCYTPSRWISGKLSPLSVGGSYFSTSVLHPWQNTVGSWWSPFRELSTELCVVEDAQYVNKSPPSRPLRK